MGEPSAMMAQYNGVRDRYPGHIILFRVGDFFESFGKDAEMLSRELDIVLTSRQNDSAGQRIPMAGVPQHALETYLSRLVRKGHRVVVCDQVEDPSTARGLIERAVTRVVTPGTVVEESLLPRGQSNYLAIVVGSESEGHAVVLVEVSTAETMVRTYPPGPITSVVHEIALLQPPEVLLDPSVAQEVAAIPSAWRSSLPRSRQVSGVLPVPVQEFPANWRSETALPPLVERALGMAASYVSQCAPALLGSLSRPGHYDRRTQMTLDITTLRHLEITEPMNPSSEGSRTLLDVLDRTESPAGRRTLVAWLTAPLAEVPGIERRLEAVDWFLGQKEGLVSLRKRIHQIADLSRLAARVLARRATPRDVRAIGTSLNAARELGDLLRQPGEDRLPGMLRELLSPLTEETTLADELLQAIPEDAPAVLTNSGSLNPRSFLELQQLRDREAGAMSELSDLERKEASLTGIKNLKVGYTQVFGYYFEVTRVHFAKVPQDRWRRKQTLANAERYTSEELQSLEARLLSTREESERKEADLWNQLVARVAEKAPILRRVGDAVGVLDALSSFAYVAKEKGWVRPKVTPGEGIRIREGRHPVLEELLGPAFVPNDAELGAGAARLLLLTGPNMAGKSTYMRMVGLIVYLAQCGSFVPARYAEVGLVNYLATRMGFTDETGHGKSSFMVEMSEVAEILSRADASSLILLDEVGRGTSTSDGLAIAWAIVHHLHDRVQARTIVATHYHQLADMVASLSSAQNSHLGVHEREGEITFLRTLLPGATNKSYGIHVAKLAGLPLALTREASSTLRDLEGRVSVPSAKEKERGTSSSGPRYTQALLLRDAQAERALEIFRELEKIDTHSMTPIEALNRLHQMVEKVRQTPDKHGG